MITPIIRLLKSAHSFSNRTIGTFIEPTMALFLRKSYYANSPIFIIGAPRSGTTLTFQVITYTLNVGYLTNLHRYFFGVPAIVSLVTRRKEHTEDFRSLRGRTQGLFAPSECGEWWYRFFPRKPVYASCADVTNAAMRRFKRSLSEMAMTEQRPLVFKNLYAGMRLEPITSQFPGALFIHVKRNLRDNAHSILESRMVENGSYEKWWSVSPPGYEAFLKLTPEVQAVSQINLINQQIRTDVDRLGLNSRVMTVDYEDLCKNPTGFIENLEEFLHRGGVNSTRRSAPPKKFNISQKNKLPKDLNERLSALVNSKKQ